MSRTTVDIDTPILNEIRRIGRESGQPMGRVISDLLAAALGARRAKATRKRSFQWISRPMGARVDLEDKEAVFRALLDDECRS